MTPELASEIKNPSLGSHVNACYSFRGVRANVRKKNFNLKDKNPE